MKNLLAFTAFLAAGFLLGSRRARKAGPITQLGIEVVCDAKNALAQLKELEQQAAKTAVRLEEVNHNVTVHLSGRELVGMINLETDRLGRVGKSQ